MAFRTDLAVEAIENHKTAAALPHVRQSDRTLEGFAVHEVRILSEDAAREIGKPQGRYLTLELDALIRREEDAFPRACKALSTLLRELLPHPNNGPVLIAGLGNRMITPDAIGPQTADHVIATRHLVAQSPAIFADWRPVSALAPGVLGQTGVETGEVICGVLDRVCPAAVIAVDALAAGRLSRLLRTVQLADTGITPGPAWETPAQRSTRKHSACRLSPLVCRPWWTVQRSHMRSAASLGSLPAKRWTTSLSR